MTAPPAGRTREKQLVKCMLHYCDEWAIPRESYCTVHRGFAATAGSERKEEGRLCPECRSDRIREYVGEYGTGVVDHGVEQTTTEQVVYCSNCEWQGDKNELLTGAPSVREAQETIRVHRGWRAKSPKEGEWFICPEAEGRACAREHFSFVPASQLAAKDAEIRSLREELEKAVKSWKVTHEECEKAEEALAAANDKAAALEETVGRMRAGLEEIAKDYHRTEAQPTVSGDTYIAIAMNALAPPNAAAREECWCNLTSTGRVTAPGCPRHGGSPEEQKAAAREGEK